MPDCRVEVQPRPSDAGNMQSAGANPETPVPDCPPGSTSSNSQSMKSLGEELSQMSSQERAQWSQSAERADRLDGIRRPEPDPKRLRLDDQHLQRYGDRVFPPSMPAPPPSGLTTTGVEPENRGENVPLEVSSSASSGPESGFISSDNATMQCAIIDHSVRDSAAAAVSLSSIHEEDQAADFVLYCEDGEDSVLLAGGRNEINLRDPKWKDETWKKQLIAGIRKETKNVIEDKKALRPLSLEQSRLIRQTASDRIVPSKLVLTQKIDESGAHIVKARWTARGDKDPDLFSWIREGKTQAPTISSNGRYTVLQTIASHRFKMQLGDVTGAFLEADNFHRKNGAVYMSGPSNHPLPDHHPEQLYEVIHPIYGFNDSPQSWFVTFKETAIKMTWQQSRLDPCVFFLRQQSKLIGVMGVHVDDVLIGGSGRYFEEVLHKLRSTFPFRKWKEWSGEFCGSSLRQDPQSYEIVVSQEEFAEKLTKPKLRLREEPSMQVNDEEVTSLRSCLGGALWLAKETRPDLSVQVSMGQQEAMDVLRGAIVSKKYHLHAESTVMDAAAEQRQRRLAKRQEPSASVSAQGSQVLCVQCCARDMVKVDAKGFDHSEVRALFEVMVSQCVESEESYEKHITQNSTLCRARLAAKHVNSQKFRGEEALVTYAFHKSTGMITVSCGAVFVDEAQKMLSEVLKIYKVVIKDGKIDPLPEGAQAWGRALNYLMDKGIVSQYVLNQDAPSEGGKLEEAKERQMFVPKDEEFHAAVADLCGEVARKLHNYPAWRNSLLQVMLRDYGANPDQVIELSGLAEQYDLTQDDLIWDSVQEVDQPMAQAKAKSASFKGRAGYRGQVSKDCSAGTLSVRA
eukprot:s4017_g2.t1